MRNGYEFFHFLTWKMESKQHSITIYSRLLINWGSWEINYPVNLQNNQKIQNYGQYYI